MTEAEWLGSTDPTPMFEFLRGKANERKLLISVHAGRDSSRPGLLIVELPRQGGNTGL